MPEHRTGGATRAAGVSFCVFCVGTSARPGHRAASSLEWPVTSWLVYGCEVFSLVFTSVIPGVDPQDMGILRLPTSWGGFGTTMGCVQCTPVPVRRELLTLADCRLDVDGLTSTLTRSLPADVVVGFAACCRQWSD